MPSRWFGDGALNAKARDGAAAAPSTMPAVEAPSNSRRLTKSDISDPFTCMGAHQKTATTNFQHSTVDYFTRKWPGLTMAGLHDCPTLKRNPTYATPLNLRLHAVLDLGSL